MLGLLRHHIPENISDGDAHAFVLHVQLVGVRRHFHIDFHQLVLQLSVSQLTANLLPCHGNIVCRLGVLRILLVLVLLLLAGIPTAVEDEVKGIAALSGLLLFLCIGNQRFQNQILCTLIRDIVFLIDVLLLRDANGGFHQIPNHGFHVAAHIAHFGVLCRFHFNKRSFHNPR